MLKRRKPPFQGGSGTHPEAASAEPAAPMTTSRADKTMRADARQNHERLLAAATEAFAEAGADIALDAIARRAGVGVGTLYRHFPTREALVEAVYRSAVGDLCAAADDLLASHPPDVALAEWMDRVVGYAAGKRGMAGALSSAVASGSDIYGEVRSQMLGAIGTLLAAGVATGTLRRDVAAEDVLRAMSAVWQIDDVLSAPEQAHSLLRLLMDGLRYGTSG
jgi:AcrR family transcriptional regulator